MAIDQVLLYTDGEEEVGAIQVDPINTELIREFASYISMVEGLKAGLWVVRDSDDFIHVMSDEDFNKTYQKV